MPVSTEKLYNMPKLHRWFALSCVAMLASLIWMIWEDYDRPWRGFQDQYMFAQAALARLDFLDTQTEAFQKQVEVAEAAVEAARQRAESRAAERKAIEEKLAAEKAKHDGVAIEFGNAEAVLQVVRAEYETARTEYGEKDPRTVEVRERMEALVTKLSDFRATKEHIEDAQRQYRKQLKQIDAEVTQALKKLDRLRKQAADAEKKEREYSNPVVKTIINLPLADFTAPKGTPSRYEIKQLVLPDVRTDLNYLKTYTTDRCTTCHVAINDKAFSQENLARRFERSIPAINEALVRDGDQPLPYPAVPELAGEEVPELAKGKVTEHWEFLSDQQRDDYFEALLAVVNRYLKHGGMKQVKFEQPILAHPDLHLFVDVDSPHPMAKVGCSVCHEGNPQETDFVQAAHVPVTHEQEKEWKEKYYVTAAFIPNTTFETVEHFWERPMLPPRYSEAGCAKCHTRVSDISQFRGESQAQKINLGQDLFVRVGCINCHKVTELGDRRKVGPDLRRVGSKLRPEFAEQWIFNPKKFRPSTWMPHFFLQENNGPGGANDDDPHPVLRTETEVAAITHYLFELSKTWTPPAIPAGLTGDADRGRKLFREVGCLGCHANVAEFGRSMIIDDLVNREGRSERVAEALADEMNYIEKTRYMLKNLPTDRDTIFAPESVGDRPQFTRHAPELSAIGQKVSREWLFGWLKDPKGYNDNTLMPSLRLTDQEALDLAEYLLTLKENDEFVAERFPADQAHTETVDELIMTILRSQNSARRSRAILNDENGELTNILVNSLRTYWGESQAHDRIGRMNLPDKQMLFLGSKMIAHYGCYACHVIGGFEDTPAPGTDLSAWGQKPLSQLDFAFFDNAHEHIRKAQPEVFGHVYRPEDKELIYWALDRNPEESVSHTHAGFAVHKLLNPRIWDREKLKRPYEKLKMPNFYLRPREADALVTYLLSRKASNVHPNLMVKYDSTLKGAIAEGRSLTRSLNCVGCHKIEDNVAILHQYITTNIGGEMTFDEVNAPPWLRGEGAKVQYPWLYGFLNNVERLRPWLKLRMPSFNLSDDELTTLVQYFAGISQDESAALASHLASVDRFLQKARTQADGGDQPEKQAGLWYMTDALRDTAQFLADYAVKNRLVLKYDVDPAYNAIDDMVEGYATMLERLRFTESLFDVRFPFADTPRPLVSEERFKRGEEFFYELKCLACHVLGDPNIKGSNANPTAPNLALTHVRLRQEWTHAWLQEPAVIQPGTKMPQWFPGGNGAFASYPEEDRKALEAKYGRTGEEQMQLLMDFVYNAGVKNYTALQPGGLPSEAAPAEEEGTQEEGFGDEEEEEGWDDDG